MKSQKRRHWYIRKLHVVSDIVSSFFCLLLCSLFLIQCNSDSSPSVSLSKTVLDSEFHAVDFRVRMPVEDSGFFVRETWIPGLKLLAEFWILWAGLRMLLKPRISDSTRKNVPYSGIRIPLQMARFSSILILLPARTFLSSPTDKLMFKADWLKSI